MLAIHKNGSRNVVKKDTRVPAVLMDNPQRSQSLVCKRSIACHPTKVCYEIAIILPPRDLVIWINPSRHAAPMDRVAGNDFRPQAVKRTVSNSACCTGPSTLLIEQLQEPAQLVGRDISPLRPEARFHRDPMLRRRQPRLKPSQDIERSRRWRIVSRVISEQRQRKRLGNVLF